MRFQLFVAGASAAAAVAVAAASHVPGRAFDRFLTIWLENQDFTPVSTNPSISSLAQQGILLTSFYGLTHPSQPNYMASVAGDYFGLNHDGFVTVPENVSTVVDLFDEKGIEWKGYFEGILGPGYMGEGGTGKHGGWDYVRKHNPFVSFESVSLNGTRLAQIQSFADFERDVKADRLPQYAHLSPNMLNDGHNTSLEYAASWSSAFLAPLLANPAFMNRTLVLLTYDESATYEIPNRIVSILLGGAVPDSLKGTTDDRVYTHYSILSTLQNNWDLQNLGRYDVGANVFDLVASQTGYINRHPSNELSINNSLSYGGFLNNDEDKRTGLPPPNLQLIGAGGKGVHPMVQAQWSKAAKEMTPYDGSGDIFDGGDGTKNVNKPIYKQQAPAENQSGKAYDSPPAKSGAMGGGANAGIGLGLYGLGWLLVVGSVF